MERENPRFAKPKDDTPPPPPPSLLPTRPKWQVCLPLSASELLPLCHVASVHNPFPLAFDPAFHLPSVAWESRYFPLLPQILSHSERLQSVSIAPTLKEPVESSSLTEPWHSWTLLPRTHLSRPLTYSSFSLSSVCSGCWAVLWEIRGGYAAGECHSSSLQYLFILNPFQLWPPPVVPLE